MFNHLLAWLVGISRWVLLVCSFIIVFYRQYPPLLRFGAMVAVFLCFVAYAITYFYLTTAPFLVAPVACFGLYLAVRFLWRPSVLSCLFAGCSLVCWLDELIYLFQCFITYARR